MRVSAPFLLAVALLAQDNDGGPPKLKRGKPEGPRQTTKTSEATPGTPNDPRPPAADESAAPSTNTDQPREAAATAAANEPSDPLADPFIQHAREVSAGFIDSLPNFLCQQMVTRYQTETRPVSWQALDTMSMDLVYEDGKESYKNIKINGKLTNKSLEESGGAYATGDFGTLQQNVMDRHVDADFYSPSSSRMNGKDAIRYNFAVAQENSNWTIIAGTERLKPAHKGAIWFEKETGRVLRIEMEADHIPTTYPWSSAEWALDYGYTRIGDKEYLVPTHSEILNCQRGSRACQRNVTEFRNYRRYGGNSTITFE